MVRHICLVLFVLASTVATARGAATAAIDWRPQKTWVLIVGTLEWEDSEEFESFPKENRRDAQLARFFRQQGVPSDRIVFLKDEQATTGRAQSALLRILEKSERGDLLFFYFTGHGYQSDDESETYFATYDASDDQPGWSPDEIVRTIARRFRGDRVILTADCCFSGALAERVRRLNPPQSFACFTSSTSKESSTGNWTFTEMLLAGLKGEPFTDLNDDGDVTLGEIARGLREDMQFAEEQKSVSVFTGNLGAETRIATAPPKADDAIGRRVEVRSEGDWYKARIIGVKDNRYHVHYFGYEVEDDEWVRPQQVRQAR